MTEPQTHPCHCGNPLGLDRCCGPLLCGNASAETAEQLMRSRFSAFCSANIDYLIATHHPSKRQADDPQQLRQTIEQCKWLSLNIKTTRQGAATNTTGEVEYIAIYKQQGQLSQLRENSRFVKEQGQWFYLDGDIIETTDQHSNNIKPSKTGRNNACWCGSGKKFKHCHG